MLVVFLIGCLFLVFRSITIPPNLLKKILEEVVDGGLNESSNIVGSKEIIELTGAFNRMKESIRYQFYDLESKAKKRIR